MSKFHWPLKKCFEYVKKKKEDMEINAYYRNKLAEYEKVEHSINSHRHCCGKRCATARTI